VVEFRKILNWIMFVFFVGLSISTIFMHSGNMREYHSFFGWGFLGACLIHLILHFRYYLGGKRK